jgi:hypothetical protein
MLLPDCGFDLPAERDLVDLYEANKSFIFPDSGDLSINRIANSDIEALHWQLIFKIIGPMLGLSEYSDDGSIDKVVVMVETLLKLLLLISGDSLAGIKSFVDRFVHIIL